MKKILLLLLITFTFFTNAQTKSNKNSFIEVRPNKPISLNYIVKGSLTKKLVLKADNKGAYAGLSVFVNDILVVDDINLPQKGKQKIISLVKFPKLGNVKIRFQSLDATIIINNYYFEDISKLQIPNFKDISTQAGLDKVSSLKYGGPSVADIDNDGDYDFIINNHNAESSKLYWNNGDGTVTKHNKDLSRWFKHDLHGTALGDYDNDGDLDLMLTQGGGNGKNPSISNFYLNNNNNFVRFTGDVGINKGGRGRGAKWIDADLDGDLDLLIFNESSLNFTKPQHYFYENNGKGKFKYRPVKGIQDVEESRVLVTDFNNDAIDDLILYSPITLWKGNGDFTYTNVTHLLPKKIKSLQNIMAITDLDIDNDGDLDLYLARGMQFEHGKGEKPSLDFNPITKELSFKTRGYKGEDAFDFTAENSIKLHKYYYLAQGSLLGKPYPIFLGKNKDIKIVNSGEDIVITEKMAQGFPTELSKNGFYIGYLGNSKWKAVLVRDDNFFWQYKFSLTGIKNVIPKFIPHNRNQPDVLLRNDKDKFTDVSKEWNVPKGGNALGVTTGDFNNDSHQDLFVYRWGRIGERISDLMLLNTGKKSFAPTTMHNANDIGGPGNGDMGQAFDFNLDGKVDLLNGSEGGEWYLYSNNTKTNNNSVNVRVGYSPKSNVDAIGAEVIVETKNHTYKKRVGSAGAIFSQSLLNIVHFGLGDEKQIQKIIIRWRNGEELTFKNKASNTTYDSNKPDLEQLSIETSTVRKGSKEQIVLSKSPKNTKTNLNWVSSNENILKVDKNGVVTVTGKVNQSAIITATGLINNVTTSKEIKIVKWFPKPATSIKLQPEKTMLYVGDSLHLFPEILPKNADNSQLMFTSNNKNILSVNNHGFVNALSPGKTIISVSTIDKSIVKEIIFEVKPFVKPFIEILNKAQLKDTLFVGDDINIHVKYHAGSGNKVIFSDEGGIRFWLRHFRSKWIPVKDIVKVNKKTVYSVSGKSSTSISLKDLIPTKDLPKGHFYQLRTTFTSSDGTMYSDDILPLQINSKE